MKNKNKQKIIILFVIGIISFFAGSLVGFVKEEPTLILLIGLFLITDFILIYFFLWRSQEKTNDTDN